MGKATSRARLVVVLLVSWVAGCASLGAHNDPPRVTLVNVKPLDVQLLEQRFTVTLRIQNPSESALEVKGMDYEITLNDRRFATGVNNRAFTVPAFGERTIDVPVSSTLLRIIEQLSELDRSPRKTFSYGLSGGLSVQGALRKVPFSFEDELDLSNLRRAPKAKAI